MSDPRKARLRAPLTLMLAFAFGLMGGAPSAQAVPEDVFDAVVSVLPVWPDRPQGGAAANRGQAPEGSGVAVREGGVIATAWHVIAPAERIDVRLSDGRVLPAKLIAADAQTDVALIRVAAALPVVELAPRPGRADRVCAIGNAFGLGLSVTCGVVSALDVADAGFNAVEDFVQTDAAVNPGVSGGALVDDAGRLVGMVSAIFASDGDANIGVNFAVSAPLLDRVTTALLTDGAVAFPEPGWVLSDAPRAQRAVAAGAVVVEVAVDGPAAAAGVLPGDVLTRVGDRAIRSPRDATAALAILDPGLESVDVSVLRDGEARRLSLPLRAPTAPSAAAAPSTPPAESDCPHPAPVCAARQAVFPVSGFDPIASATRIGPALLVTNRHVVGDQRAVTVFTPTGPLEGRVVSSAFEGDLALIAVEGLPDDGLIASLEEAGDPASTEAYFAVGADVARQEIRVFGPGALLFPPEADPALSRLHVTTPMQPGVSGGAVLDATGALVGIAVGGGEGRYEALPIAAIRRLLALRDAPDAEAAQDRLGAAFATCAAALDGEPDPAALAASCDATGNPGQQLAVGRRLGQAGAFEDAIAFHGRAAAQTPNSINARLSLLVSLQLGGRFEAMIPHARWLLTAASDDPSALRFAIRSGVWGGAPELAEAGYAALLKADPLQAEAARRFIDAAPPAPPRR